MSKPQLLASWFVAIFLASFPWVTNAAEPDNGPPTVPFQNLSFSGNRTVKGHCLTTVLDAFHAHHGDDYDLGDVDADTGRLTTFYRGLGFSEARVAREVVFDSNHHAAGVIFHVTEGPRAGN